MKTMKIILLLLIILTKIISKTVARVGTCSTVARVGTDALGVCIGALGERLRAMTLFCCSFFFSSLFAICYYVCSPSERL